MRIDPSLDTSDILQIDDAVKAGAKDGKGNEDTRIDNNARKLRERSTSSNQAEKKGSNDSPSYVMSFNYYSAIPKLIRGCFLLFGIGFVLYGFYRTMLKVGQNNVLISEEVVVEDKYTYPSITFCYKYKHGGKDVLKNYYPSLYEKWKLLGLSLIHI